VFGKSDTTTEIISDRSHLPLPPTIPRIDKCFNIDGGSEGFFFEQNRSTILPFSIGSDFMSDFERKSAMSYGALRDAPNIRRTVKLLSITIPQFMLRLHSVFSILEA